MKLSEALILRKDIQSRLDEMENRLCACALTQEGESPAEDPAALLAEAESLTSQLSELCARINLTNSRTMTEGQSLTELLPRRAGTQAEPAVQPAQQRQPGAPPRLRARDPHPAHGGYPRAAQAPGRLRQGAAGAGYENSADQLDGRSAIIAFGSPKRRASSLRLRMSRSHWRVHGQDAGGSNPPPSMLMPSQRTCAR